MLEDAAALHIQHLSPFEVSPLVSLGSFRIEHGSIFDLCRHGSLAFLAGDRRFSNECHLPELTFI